MCPVVVLMMEVGMPVIPLTFDNYRPRKPPPTKDLEIAQAADIGLLQSIELWARTERQNVERQAAPLKPAARVRVLLAHAAINDQPL